MDGHSLSNTAHHKCLPKNTKVMWYYVAAEELPVSNKKDGVL